MQLLQRFPAQPRAGLRYARLARHLDLHRRAHQPLHPLQQAAQHLAIRKLHVKRQRDHVVDHKMGWQIALALAAAARCRQHRIDLLALERPGDDAKAYIVRDPAARRQFRRRARHPSLLSVAMRTIA